MLKSHDKLQLMTIDKSQELIVVNHHKLIDNE